MFVLSLIIFVQGRGESGEAFYMLNIGMDHFPCEGRIDDHF